MFKLTFKKILPLAVVGIFIAAYAANAVEILPPCAKSGDCQLNDMVLIFINVSKWILSIVGSVALLFFIYGGFVWIFSGGNETTVKKGKDILIGAIIGLFIVFSSFLIIQFSVEALTGKKGTGTGLNINTEFK